MLKFGLALSILLTIPGELIRLPFGPGEGLLLNDVFLPLLIIFWLMRKLLVDRKFPKTPAGLPLAIFIAVAIASLVASLRFLGPQEALPGLLYLIRFIEYAFLYFITADLIKKEKDIHRILAVMIGSAVLIAIAGFIQFKLYPDFRPMEDLGWDPHVGRLLSTWFDPNFVGGMFTFVSCLVMGLLLTTKKYRPQLVMALGLLVIAIFLTYSRSSYLALAAGILVIGILKSRKALLGIIIAIIILVPFSERAQTRIIDTYHSAKAIITDTAETPDITSQHRLNSWKRAITMTKNHPIIGIGYNNFKIVQSKEGLIMDPNSHAATGSDSTLLNFLATTGPLGLLAMLFVYINLLKASYKNRKTWQVGTLAGTIALLVHAIFVNSLLFPWILVYFWILNGIKKA